MRIIGGSFRGKKLLDPKDIKTRPLKDLAKESIFNIINHSNKFKINLKSSNVLDLFSGVGSFGIECLSRGVNQVIFIENYDKVLSILKKNLDNLKIVKNYKIFELNIVDGIEFKNFNIKFDIIFLDPPFKDKNLKNILSNILNTDILKKGGIVIVHRHKNEKDSFPKGLKIIEQKKYGLSKIIFLN